MVRFDEVIQYKHTEIRARVGPRTDLLSTTTLTTPLRRTCPAASELYENIVHELCVRSRDLQSINQSINQPTNQPTNQLINQFNSLAAREPDSK